MDKEYRDNIVGSPYLDEGIGQQLKAKTASAISAGQATLGHQLDNPLHAKIKPHWETFMSQLLRILKDVRDQIEPLIRNRQAQTVDPETGKTSSPVTPEQDELLTSMLNLLNSIVPSKYLANTLSTGRPESTYSLGNVVKESLWDAARRDMDLNKIIAGRNPTKILNAFKNKILSLYEQFLMGASKSTRIPKESIAKITKGIYPPTKYHDILNKIESIKNTPDLVETHGGTPAATSPAAVTPPAPAAGAGAKTPAALAGSGPSPSGAAGEVKSSGSIASNKNDIAAIILKVIKIIIDTVKSDISHAAPFVGPEQAPFPTKWGQPTVTEAEDDDDEKKPKDFDLSINSS